MLFQCWAGVYDAVLKLNQHCLVFTGDTIKGEHPDSGQNWRNAGPTFCELRFVKILMSVICTLSVSKPLYVNIHVGLLGIFLWGEWFFFEHCSHACGI